MTNPKSIQESMIKVKKVRKNDIKYNVQLDDQQKLVKSGIYSKDISIILGDFGSGKTLTAALIALDLLFTNQIEKIYITRPIDFKATGYLTGPQPLYSKVLTPNGWNTIKEIKVGEDIICPDGSYSKVIDKSVINKEPVYEIQTTDGRIMRCSRYHLFHTLTYNDKKHRLDKIKYNKNYEGSVKSLDKIINTFLTNKGKLNHYIPYNNPIKFKEEKNHFIPPYTLGCLLGDGCLSTSISFSNIDNELIDKLTRECESKNMNVRKVKNRISYTISSNNKNNKPGKEIIIEDLNTKEIKKYKNIGEALIFIKDINKSTLHSRCEKNLTINNIKYSFGKKEAKSTNEFKEELTRLGLNNKGALEKFIPKEYIYNSSINNRLELLRGLMDTDGTNDGNAAVFTTISEQLKDSIIELVHSLGGRASFYTRNRINDNKKRIINGRNIYNRHISYEISISLDFNPFYISRKAIKYCPKYRTLIGLKSIKEVSNDYVQCIKIDSEKGLYITDNYVTTHNSADEKMMYHIFPIKQNFYECYNKEKIDSLFREGKIQIVPIDYMKGMTFCNSCTIVDEFEDISYEDFKKILTRLGKGSKLIFTGSEEQIEINNSCISKIKCLQNCEDVNYHILTGQHRNENIQKILNFINNNNQS